MKISKRYEQFREAVNVLQTTDQDYVKIDDFVIVKRKVWESSVERVKNALDARERIDKAIYTGNTVANS